MKVVHVTLRFDAPGGVETTVRELCRRLRSSGEEVEVYASDLVDESGWVRAREFRAEVDGVPVRRFPVVKRPLPRFTLPMMAGLVEALAESGADVIHAHSHRYGHVLQSTAVARRCGIPLVVSTHYHPADRRETALKRGLLRAEDFVFGAASYRVADAIVVESEVEGRLVREFAPGSRIRVIPPGIDLAEWRDTASDRATDLDLPENYFLFAGRIAPNKGLSVLFDAIAQLTGEERRPLVLMGPDWGERSSLESQARALGIEPWVRWFGPYRDRATYRAVLRRARAFVLPSEWEAYGLVLLDAMAAGAPIVATAVGAVPEVLDHGRAGRLVPYGDPGALASALRSVSADPEGTRTMARAATAKVNGADWTVSAERYRALYHGLVGR